MRRRPSRLRARPRPGVAPPRARRRPTVLTCIGTQRVHLRGHQAPFHGRRQVLRRQPLRVRASP